MAICKTRSMSTIITFFWLLSSSQCYRQEDELEKLIMDIDVSQDKVVSASNRTQPDFKLDIACFSISSTGCTAEPQFLFGVACPLGSASVGIAANNGALEVTCAAAVTVDCAFKFKNIGEFATNCKCVGAPCPIAHASAAIEQAGTWLVSNGHPQAAEILNGGAAGYEIAAKITITTPLQVGGKAAAAPGVFEDKEGFTMIGGGASAGCGLHLEAIVLAGFRPGNHVSRKPGPAWKIAVGAPHVAVALKIEPISAGAPSL